MGVNIALAGNPNCGKTTLFNDLTGANQYVGNWPGVTVEKKEGLCRLDKEVTVTDLPGVYSLSPYSPEEVVTRDYLASGRPDAVIDLVDATNLERNLYLTSQIIELGIPTVVVLNMIDLVEKNGDLIDEGELSRRLGCRVVTASALKGRGVEEAVAAAKEAAAEGSRWNAGNCAATDPDAAAGFAASTACSRAAGLAFSPDLETALARIEEVAGARPGSCVSRWQTVKLFEGDQLVAESLGLSAGQLGEISAIRESVEREQDDDAESIVANERYGAISSLCAACVRVSSKGMTLTQKIDRVVTNRVLGLPIFVALMFAVYYVAVSLGGGIVTDWANDGISGDGWLYTGTAQYEEAVGAWEESVAAAQEAGASEAELAALAQEEPDPSSFGLWIPGLTPVVSDALTAIGAADWLQSLVVDGVVAGVGAVIGFVPQLILLFLMLSFLEGCGYMARVAFIMDRIFRRFGLSGKSFIPMLIASGCGVPAVMATKTIENEKDRRMTIMTATMIPCGAKMPIIALVFGALAGGDYAATWWVAPLFYFLGLAAIILSCIMLKKLRAFAGEVAPFIMELPSYHLPTAKNVLLATWERVRSYIVKAGTIIFLSSMVIWFLMNFGVYDGSFGLLDAEMDRAIDYSLMAGLGGLLSWIFAPLGFGDWQATVTSVTGLVAKENVVATVGILTSLGDAGEADPSLWAAFATLMGGSSAAIMAFAAFNLLCAPCFAAMGAIRRQMASARWTWAAIGYMTGFAWCVGLMVYQFAGLALGEVSFNVWTVAALAVAAALVFQLLRPAAGARPAARKSGAAGACSEAA